MQNSMNPENLKIIFGIKIKSYRTEQGLSLQELSRRTGLATSYLSEIESGKKYPKPDKLLRLADTLGIDYDTLVSTKLSKSLDPFTALINSELINQFPFHLFGISASDILGLFKNKPDNAQAFLQTFLEISRAFDMSLDNFLFAALRTFQRNHNNYFHELEKLAEEFSLRHELMNTSLAYPQLRMILKQNYGYFIDETEIAKHPVLQSFRSIFRNKARLFLNNRLLPSQKAFILAREIGFNEMGIVDRPLTSSWIKVQSFEQLLNNFKASYFGGALLLPQHEIVKNIRGFLNLERWDNVAFLQLLEKHNATPEMLLYRLSQIIPGVLDLNRIFYFRFTTSTDGRTVRLTKDLNMTETLVPYGLGFDEHFCRRWLPLRLLNSVRNQHVSITSGAQRIHFIKSGTRFLMLSMARSLSLAKNRSSAIAIGIKIDKNSESLIKFIDDPAIPEEEVSETCERCPLTDCSVRVVAATTISKEMRAKTREKALQQFITSS